MNQKLINKLKINIKIKIKYQNKSQLLNNQLKKKNNFLIT